MITVELPSQTGSEELGREESIYDLSVFSVERLAPQTGLGNPQNEPPVVRRGFDGKCFI